MSEFLFSRWTTVAEMDRIVMGLQVAASMLAALAVLSGFLAFLASNHRDTIKDNSVTINGKPVTY